MRADYKEQEMWSYEEASKFSGLSRVTLYSYACKGKFKTQKHGQYRVERKSFLRYLHGTGE